MSFQEKNITASLVSFSLILVIFLISVLVMVQGDNFNSSNVFRLWGIVIVLAIVATILLTIFTHILSAIIQAIKTGDENPEIEDIQDERDRLIDLKGTRVTFLVTSIGVFIAMLTFVFSQPPLVMFTLLIFFGILAQVVGDISRLVLYRRGF
jgi:protein-S-isoprenylcysteine O-methyltransferase Ste14